MKICDSAPELRMTFTCTKHTYDCLLRRTDISLTFSTELHVMSGKKARVVAELPEEPAFLRRIKQQIGYKESTKNITDKVRTVLIALSSMFISAARSIGIST